MACIQETNQNEFLSFSDNCDPNAYIATYFFSILHIVVEVAFMIMYVVHLHRNNWQFLLRTNDTHKKPIPTAQNYTRASMFIILGLRSVVTILAYCLRLGLGETFASRGWATTIITSATACLFWASVFAYRVSITGLYVLLDKGKTQVSMKNIGASYSIILVLYTVAFYVGAILGVLDVISQYTWQIWFFYVQGAMVIAGSPLWLIFPLRMLKQLKARKFPQSAKGARNEQNTEFLIKKLKAGLLIQGLSAFLALVVSILAVTVPYFQENATIMFHSHVHFGAWSAFLFFFVFGGLSRGKYAHSSYYKETSGKSGVSSIDNYNTSSRGVGEKPESKSREIESGANADKTMSPNNTTEIPTLNGGSPSQDPLVSNQSSEQLVSNQSSEQLRVEVRSD